ncbi:MAG TPA: hypothetical protein VF889_03730 [Bacteroidota bacterium]
MHLPERHWLLSLAVAALLAGSCSPRGEPRPLDQEQFARLYVQLTRAGVSVRDLASDTLAARRRADDVLRRAGVSRSEVEATVRWYNEDVTRWKGLFDEVMRIATDQPPR